MIDVFTSNNAVGCIPPRTECEVSGTLLEVAASGQSTRPRMVMSKPSQRPFRFHRREVLLIE